MNNIRKTIIVGAVYMLFAILALRAPSAEAKKKTPTFNKKSITLKKGNKTKISIKNVSAKKVKWSTNKTGKSVITLSSKKKKSVMVRGKKAGTATVTAKLTLKGNKTKILKAKVKVSAKERTGNVTVANKKQTAFPGSIKASLTETGYVKLQWDKVTGAHAYVLQRKTGAEDWKELKVTASVTFTDRTVKENTAYQYRVRANCDGMCTAFSDAVTVTTGKMGENSSKDPVPTTEPTAVPGKTPVPDPEPTKKPETKPYEAKYTYEVEVLNQFTIYENVPVVLYIKTDNPDPNGITGGVTVDFNDYDNFGEGITRTYKYEDVQYLDQEETEMKLFRKVKGGWIYTHEFEKAGVKTISIGERDQRVQHEGHPNSTEQFIEWRKQEYPTVDTFQIIVKDRETGLQEYCDNIIKTVSDESYNEDGLGKWSALSEQQRMERLEEYVVSHMHYPRIGAETSLGYLPIWIIQENVGAYWETGFADCGASNDLMCALAKTLGYDAHLQNTTLNGALHIVAMVTIDGEEYKYDATPWQGGYKDYDYIL